MNNLCPRCRASRKDEAVVSSLLTVWFSCTRCECVWRGSILQLAVGCVRRGVWLPLRSRVGEGKIQTEARPLTTNAPHDFEVSNQLGGLELALAKQNEFGDGITTSDDVTMTEDLATWLGEQESVNLSPVALVTVDNLIEMMDARAFNIADGRLSTLADRRAPIDTGRGPIGDGRGPIDDGRRPIDDDAFFAAFGDDMTSSQPLRAAADNRPAPEASACRSPMGVGRSPLASRRSPIADAASKDELTSSVDQMLKNVDGVADAFVRLQEQFAGMERWCQELLKA